MIVFSVGEKKIYEVKLKVEQKLLSKSSFCSQGCMETALQGLFRDDSSLGLQAQNIPVKWPIITEKG